MVGELGESADVMEQAEDSGRARVFLVKCQIFAYARGIVGHARAVIQFKFEHWRQFAVLAGKLMNIRFKPFRKALFLLRMH